MLKNHKIRSAYLVVNCVGLRTFWMPLVNALVYLRAALSSTDGPYGDCKSSISTIQMTQVDKTLLFQHGIIQMYEVSSLSIKNI